MGGILTGLVIATVTFLLGTLATHWTADHLLLWQTPITRESLLSAHEYYSNTLVPMPPLFTNILHGIGLLGVLTLGAKVWGGRESNWLFDGASLFLFGASAVVYFSSILPSLSALPPTIPTPIANPSSSTDPTFVPLRELAASNAVLAAALIGILLLQSGQYFSQRLEERERAEEEEARTRRRERRKEIAERKRAGGEVKRVEGGVH